jgi:MFS family permease
MVWRNPDFLKLWLGHAVSLFGSEITALAIPLTAILTLDAGPIEMGILAASGTTPSLIFGLAAGVWVDRVRRRPVLIASDLIRASLLLSIPAAWALGGLTLPYLVVVTFLIGVCTVLFDVAHTSYLPSVLAPDELVEGNSKLEVSESLNQFAGPGAGGLIVQAVGAPLAIVADSVTFLASAAFLGRIRAKEVVVARSPTSPGVLAEASEGLRTVIAHPILRPTAGYAATGSLFMQALLAVYLLYLVDELRLQPALVGLVSMAAAPGTILGALLAGWTVRRFGMGATMCGVALAVGVGALLFPLAAGPPQVSVPILMGAWFLVATSSLYDIHEVSLRQALTPDRLRGRVNATRYLAFFGVMPIGALLGGLLGAVIGLRPTLLVAAAGVLAASLWIFLSPIRRLAELPTRNA